MTKKIKTKIIISFLSVGFVLLGYFYLRLAFADLFVNCGTTFYKKGDYKKAALFYKSALSLAFDKKVVSDEPMLPTEQEIYRQNQVMLADSYLKTAQYDEVIKLFHRIRSYDLEINDLFATAKLRSGDLDSAEQYYQNLFKFHKTVRTSSISIDGKTLPVRDESLVPLTELTTPLVDAKSLSMLSEIYRLRQDYLKAVDYVKQAIAIIENQDKNPKIQYRYPHVQLASIYLDMKEYDKALELLKKVQEDDPQEIYAQFYLGKLYDQQNQKDLAIENYKKFFEAKKGYQEDRLLAESRIKFLDSKV